MNERYFAVAIAVFGLTLAAFAAPALGREYQWAWMKGSDEIDQPGEYGELGVEAEANTPGARSGSVSWTADAGRLWLFGGQGLDKDGNSGGLNDLWRYDPATGNWTWIKGADVSRQPGVYGELGVEAEANTPGARSGSVSWTDDAGRLWLFGGRNYIIWEFLNDLWRYDPATGNWAWMKGSDEIDQPGEYGELGVEAEANTPGARDWPVSWTDDAGRLWLFGGYGRDKDGDWHYLNDLWRYDPDTGNWTWMKGSDEIAQAGVYGELGVEAEANTPGARSAPVSWTDDAGRLWLFGGWGFDKDGEIGSLNDLWRYDPATGNWAWMKGSDEKNQQGEYGELGVEAEANTPGGRENSASWTDDAGNLWLFGGGGMDGEDNWSKLNDLWRYDPATGNWAWMKGTDERNQPGVYGELGVEAEANTPGARFDIFSWNDDAGNLWLFGGSGLDKDGSNGWLNDLWRFSLPPPAIAESWYLPAGGTELAGTAVDTYILIFNPGPEAAPVELVFVGGNGEIARHEAEVAPSSRATFRMNDHVAEAGTVSTIVISLDGLPLAVERSSYWAGGESGTQAAGEWAGGHNAPALDLVEETWYLAEGATHLFDLFIHVLNPDPLAAAEVEVTFFDQQGNDWSVLTEVPALSNRTVEARVEAGERGQLSARVESLNGVPVAVDRTTYWPRGGPWTDGHASVGTPAAGLTWRLAEGATHIFDCYLAIHNPSVTETAEILIGFTGAAPGIIFQPAEVGPLSRYTLKVNDVVGPAGAVAATVVSDIPVVAERAMYWPQGSPDGWTGGHGSAGTPQAFSTWRLAEGAAHIFDCYLLIFNPSDTDAATVDFNFLDKHGDTIPHQETVAPLDRTTVKVNDLVGSLDAFSTEATSDIPVVVERAIYWPKGGPWIGGHSSLGVGE